MSNNYVEFGAFARLMKAQFPELSDYLADQFDQDNEALFRLSVRGYLTDSAKQAVMKKITKRIEQALRHSTRAKA